MQDFLAGLRRAAAILPVLGGLCALAAGPPEAKDPLAAEIDRWSRYLQANTSKDEGWAQVKGAVGPLLQGAADALRDGRNQLALLRLATVRHYLSADRYLGGLPAGALSDAAGLETEWTRVGREIRGDLAATDPAALDGVRPASVRAIAEAAAAQVKTYYDASLEYGRNTVPRSGFFYIGIAQAQRELVSLCRALSRPSPLAAPPLRSLSRELDSLEGELLAAYRPPAAIDRHGEFIAASSMLKEARELDAAGLRYGATLRYLQAVLRLAPLRPPGKPLEPAALAGRLQELEARLSGGGVDHSIGRLFLEAAQADVEAARPGKTADAAQAIAVDILPRYFVALAPARPEPPKPAPAVTVTLVRWPYT
ncbi:MAG: hypothetical protein ACM3SU_16115 [Acidobacteriota bacterium]